MKKLFGFTLAEVLITLGIMGVVAALTLPVLMSNFEKNQWTTGLRTNKSMIERAFSQMLAENNVDTLDLTDLWAHAISPADDIIKQYFKVSKIKTGVQSDAIYKFGKRTSFTGVNNYPCYILANGVFIYMKINYSAERGGVFANIYVDVNGKKHPNTLGKDIFAFGLTENAVLLPYGSDELYEIGQNDKVNKVIYPNWNSERGCRGDQFSIKDGRACTARVIENDYKMDY